MKRQRPAAATPLLAAIFVIVGLLAGCAIPESHAAHENAPARDSEIKPVIDQRATSELKRMADALSKAHSMGFNATSMTPIRGPNDQWVHVFSTAKVELQRPNKLSVVTGGDAFPQIVLFDGKTLSIAAAQTKLYTQTQINGSIDGMLARAAQDGGMVFPFADVLIADPYSTWMKDLEGATFIGESNRGGEKLNHISLTAKDVDWELWTSEKSHLPRMVYVKYSGEHRMPSVLIEFSKWRLGARYAPGEFEFVAANGAKKIAFKNPVPQEGGAK